MDDTTDDSDLFDVVDTGEYEEVAEQVSGFRS